MRQQLLGKLSPSLEEENLGHLIKSVGHPREVPITESNIWHTVAWLIHDQWKAVRRGIPKGKNVIEIDRSKAGDLWVICTIPIPPGNWVVGGRSIRVEHSTIHARAGVIVGGSTNCFVGYIEVIVGGTGLHREYLKGGAICDLKPFLDRDCIGSHVDVVL